MCLLRCSAVTHIASAISHHCLVIVLVLLICKFQYNERAITGVQVVAGHKDNIQLSRILTPPLKYPPTQQHGILAAGIVPMVQSPPGELNDLESGIEPVGISENSSGVLDFTDIPESDANEGHRNLHLDRVTDGIPIRNNHSRSIDLHNVLQKGHQHPDGTWHDHSVPNRASVQDLCDSCLCNPTHQQILCSKTNTRTETLVLSRNSLPSTAMHLHVEGYETVEILEDTFANDTLQINHLVFEEIESIIINEHSLHFSPHSRKNTELLITFINCNIESFPSYGFTQIDTNENKREGFDKTRFLSINMHRCYIREIQSNAFHRARVLYVNLTDVTIKSMAKKSFDLDVYKEWLVQDSSLPHLPSGAICLHAERSVIFSHNQIDELDSYAWDIEAGGQVIFEYNTVGKIRSKAFLNIHPMRQSRSANIVFLNNTVTSADDGALVTSNKYPRYEMKVQDNKFQITCECNISTYFKDLMYTNQTDKDSLQIHEAVLRNSLCQQDHLQFVNVDSFLENECSPVPVLIVAVATVIGALLLGSCTIAVICARRANKAREEASYLGETSSPSFSTMNTHHGPLQSPSACEHHHNNMFFDAHGKPSWIVAVPEVKTYKETEVHVKYEEFVPLPQEEQTSYQDQFLSPGAKVLTRQSCPFN